MAGPIVLRGTYETALAHVAALEGELAAERATVATATRQVEETRALALRHRQEAQEEGQRAAGLAGLLLRAQQELHDFSVVHANGVAEARAKIEDLDRQVERLRVQLADETSAHDETRAAHAALREEHARALSRRDHLEAQQLRIQRDAEERIAAAEAAKRDRVRAAETEIAHLRTSMSAPAAPLA